MWTKDKPTEGGWYFWKKRVNQNDSWKWIPYFIIGDECWDGTSEVYYPVGGWWSPRIRCPASD